MNRTEYIQAVADRISDYPEDFQKEILKSCCIQYDALAEDGFSEEEIITQLGTPSEVFIEIRRTYGAPRTGILDEETRNNLKNGITGLTRSGLSLISAFGSSISDTIRGHASDIREKTLHDRFARDVLIPFRISEDCRTLKIDAGRRIVDVFLRSGEMPACCLTPMSKNRQIGLAMEENGGVFLLKPEKGGASLCVEIPPQIENIEISTGGSVSTSELSVRMLTAVTTSRIQSYAHTEAETLTAESSSGTVFLHHSSFSSMRISARSGSIEAADVRGDFYGKTVSGGIHVRQHTADRFLAETKSGSLSVSVSCRTVSLTSISGSIRIFNMETPEILAAETRSGSISCSLLDTDFTAHVHCRYDRLDNRTSLPLTATGTDTFRIGTGGAGLNLSSQRGTITIS